MRFKSAFTAFALVASAALMTACSGGGGVSQLEYAPPTAFNPSSGLSPDLTNPNALPGPAAPPFNPW
ncbi:hypothetical protein [Microbaculum marinum]|uniref:Lipoprotein n=1 Tax=Microbaculum marinum TaxID=1764581 RepID=A0AAW9RKZ7_9HYPH